MRLASRSVTCLTLAVSINTAIISTCHGQEVALLDLTKVAARIDLRRPKPTSSAVAGINGGIHQTNPCPDSMKKVGTLHTSLTWLDRTHYSVDDKPTFEVTIENTGFSPVTIPFSPNLADLQPADPAQKFGYSELNITLWIAAGEDWSTNTGGYQSLYSAKNRPDTMRTLNPGEWVRIIGSGALAALDDGVLKLIRSGHPADHMYAETSFSHSEMLLTPKQSATVSRGICITQTHGKGVPIQLTTP